MAIFKIISESLCFAGRQLRLSHYSEACQCQMTFSLYLPPQAQLCQVPVLTWLSGLTCTDENFVAKAGAQQYAAKHGVALLAPDTSPRGENVADDIDNAWDFGLGAGFYLDASQAPWNKHYHMYSYITEELPHLLAHSDFNCDLSRQCIFGHSMGGHGALTIGLKNPSIYQSISAFAPICAPMQCPWGIKALTNYLGADKASWQAYDSCHLLSTQGSHTPLLIDQGDADIFLTEQLKSKLLEQICIDKNIPLTLRFQPGYDHSYFFIASFINDHIAFHAKQLE